MVCPASRTMSEICSNWLARGLLLRQTMPIVLVGCGGWNRSMETDAERVSTSTAISGISVTPMPAPTICTSVDSELPSSSSRGAAVRRLQKDNAWSRKQWPSSSSSRRISRSFSRLGTGLPASALGRTSTNCSENSSTSVNDGSEQVRIFMKINGDMVEGISVMAVEPTEAVFVNVIGNLNPAELEKVMDNFDVDIQ